MILSDFVLKSLERAHFFPPFPHQLKIETTNLCNAECVMCPREKLTRPYGFMDFSLFEKIVKEISRRRFAVKTLHFHGFGEVLLDKLLPARIKLAKKYGIRNTHFVTNGSCLTPGWSKQLIEAGLDEFKISFHGTDKETYERVMGKLNFEKSLQNIKDFFRIRDELRAKKPRVSILYLAHELNGSRTEEFRALFTPLIRPELRDKLKFPKLHNFGEGRNYNPNDGEIISICSFPWKVMEILWDGRVATCYYDFDGKQVLGDVNESTIEEIWNGPVLAKIRADFSRLNYKDYPVCAKCDRPCIPCKFRPEPNGKLH